MKWAYSLKHKVRAALVLAALTSILLLANWGSRTDVVQLDRTLTTLLNDRLMPATFVHEISNRLYENKILAAEGKASVRIQHNYNAIDKLIKKYEATQLTAEEAVQWKQFKLCLQDLKVQQTNGAEVRAKEASFTKTMLYINNLINIQVGESDRLIQNGKATVSANMLTANLGVAMCILLALFTLVILSTTDRALFKSGQRHLLN